MVHASAADNATAGAPSRIFFVMGFIIPITSFRIAIKALSLRRLSRQFGFQDDCAAFALAREVLCGPNGERAKSQTAKRGSGGFLDGWLADEAVGRFVDAHEAPLGSCPPRSVADGRVVWSRSSDCGHLSICVGNGL